MQDKTSKKEDTIKQNANNWKNPSKSHKLKYDSNQILIIIQIIVCLTIIVSVLIFKNSGLDIYEKVKDWYTEKLNDSLILPEEMDEIRSHGGHFVFKNSTERAKEDDPNEQKCCAFFLGPDDFSNVTLKDPQVVYTVSSLVNQGITFPVEAGTITSGFGLRSDPFTGKKSMHSGVDIAANENTEIYAVLPGRVEKAEFNPYYGNYMLLDHGDNFKTLYAHCNKLLADPGTYIKYNQNIALMGRTGRATGPHLHLEFIINDKKYNPEEFFI